MKNIRFPKRRILLLDELATILAFFLTLFIRYQKSFFIWDEIYDGLYVSLLIIQCLLQALIFFMYDSRRKSVVLQDPAENLISVFKGKSLLLIGSLLYLYVTQKGEMSSRFVIATLFLLGIVVSFLFRMLFRHSFLKNYKSSSNTQLLELKYPYPDRELLLSLYKSGKYEEVLIFSPESNDLNARTCVNEICRLCKSLGLRVYLTTMANGYTVRTGIISDIGGYASIPVAVRKEKYRIFGVDYAISRIEEAVHHVMSNLDDLKGEYICFSNVHTSVMARENGEFKHALNEAAFVFADGKPIASLQQKNGMADVERVAGPDFMERMFKNSQDGRISHYFYGASQTTLDALESILLEKYPGIRIKGMYSPPFRMLSSEEDEADIKRINSSGADIIWIGLGAPKQEMWMYAHKGKINGVMLGVGAGFDFHAGTIKRAPEWIQKMGFEWLFRLFQDPNRLFKRYFVTNTKFVWYLLVDMIFGENRNREAENMVGTNIDE